MKSVIRVLILVGVCLGGVAAYQLLSHKSENRVAIRIGTPVGGRIEKSDAEWREVLPPEAYRVTRRQGTERAFCGAFWDVKRDGVYECVCCGQELFDSKSKYDSGTGWPSLTRLTKLGGE